MNAPTVLQHPFRAGGVEPMKGMLAHVAVALLVVSRPGAARAAELQQTDEAPVSENMAVVEIAAPDGARIIVDGQEKKGTREVTVGPLEAGQLARHELTVRFSSGGTVSKTLLLRGGKRYRIPVRDPKAAAPELVVQTGHVGAVWSVAFSPDGKQVLTGSDDSTAILWDVATGIRLRSFEEHQNSIKSVAFSPDGKSILTGSWDGTAILWDATTGSRLQTFEGCAGSVAFSPDGQFVLMDSKDKTATLWDAATGKVLRQFEGDPTARRRRIESAARQVSRRQSEVSAVAYSADGKQVLTGESDKTAKLWDADTGEQLCTFNGHHESVKSAAFSPDGKLILTGSWDGTTILWDAAKGATLRTFAEHKPGINLFANLFFGEQHNQSIDFVAFSPDGKSILTQAWDGTAILSDVTTGNKLHTFKGHKDSVTSVSFSPDGKRVLTGLGGGAILWDVPSGDRIQAFDGALKREVETIAFSPDEGLLLSGYRDGTAIPWDTITGKRIGKFETNQRNIRSVAFSPDGKQVLTGSVDGAILWDSATKDRLRTFEGNVNSQAFSPDGATVLTWQYISTPPWRYMHTPVLWDAATGAKLRTFKGVNSNGTDRCVAFSPDGTQVLIGDNRSTHTASMWDAATGTKLETFREDRGWHVSCVMFSPDGKRALTGFGDGAAVLWNVGTQEKLRAFKGHASRVESMAFSPDGKQILTGSDDHTIVLWDTETGNKLRKFAGSHTRWVRSVVFSADGRFVVAGSDAGTVLWDIATGDELCLLIALAGDDWLAVTPEGLFDGSPGGICKVTYRIENGFSDVHPEKLSKDFQQSGLLARLLKGERPQPPKPNQ